MKRNKQIDWKKGNLMITPFEFLSYLQAKLHSQKCYLFQLQVAMFFQTTNEN